MLILFPCAFAQNKESYGFGDRSAVKTNAFEWLMTVPNIAFEYDVVRSDFQKMSFNLGVKYNWNTYHKLTPTTVFDMFDVRPEFRYYFKSEKRPWWAIYVGPYASYGTYTFKFSEKGIRGYSAGVGVSAGYVVPMYEYKKGAIDVEFGASLGMQVCTRDVFTHNPEGNYYARVESESEALHVTPFPVVSELKVAFVWRKQSIRYQVQIDYGKQERKEQYEKNLRLVKEDIDAHIPLELSEQYQTIDDLNAEILTRETYLLGEEFIRSQFYSFTRRTISSLERRIKNRSQEVRRNFNRRVKKQ